MAYDEFGMLAENAAEAGLPRGNPADQAGGRRVGRARRR